MTTKKMTFVKKKYFFHLIYFLKIINCFGNDSHTATLQKIL